MATIIHEPSYPSSILSIDGYKVPLITATKVSEQEYNLCVGSYGILVHADDVENVVFLLANAMAIAAGYTSHGERSRRANPYNVQVMQIGSVDTDAD